MIKRKHRKYLLNLRRYKSIYRRHKDFTMIGEKTFVDNLALIDLHLSKHGLDNGSIVECGTWRGGMSFAMTDLCPQIQEFHCFDSFQGLPQATDLDGETAQQLQRDGALIAVNNTASIEEFTQGLERLDAAVRKKVQVHKGWFEDTLSDFRPERPISVLRIDCDWYDSVLLVFEKLFDQVAPNGLILIDDYATWDGCSRATHDFLSQRKARERIQQTWIGRVFYMVKEPPQDGSEKLAA